jgi:hypothetical protein
MCAFQAYSSGLLDLLGDSAAAAAAAAAGGYGRHLLQWGWYGPYQGSNSAAAAAAAGEHGSSFGGMQCLW